MSSKDCPIIGLSRGETENKDDIVSLLRILLPGTLALALGYHRYMGARATRRVSVDVACLSLDQVVDIGTNSSTSMVRPYAADDGAVEWRTQSKGGVMLYRVLPLPDHLGFRIESWATTVTVAQMAGSQDLLRMRRRTLEAISRAGQPVPAPAFVTARDSERVASRVTGR